MDPILKSYYPIADMIAKTFGDSCEVVIHDLTKPQNSVVYVANNSVTGRKPGESFEHLVKQVLLNKNFHNDFTANYKFESNNKDIKSSSALIRNDKGEVVGMICINLDLAPIDKALDVLKALSHVEDFDAYKPQKTKSEEFEEVSAIINKLIDDIIGPDFDSRQKKSKNIEIIRFMDQKGIFLVKGALERVASKMNLSKVTVYSYLDEIHREKTI